jgi:hypothetical protein
VNARIQRQGTTNLIPWKRISSSGAEDEKGLEERVEEAAVGERIPFVLVASVVLTAC